MDALWIYVLIYAVLGNAVGLSVSTVSFTAWALVVPLLFAIFDFDIFQSIYVSMFVDLVNCFCLFCLYSISRYVFYTLAGLTFLISAFGIIPGFIFADFFLDDFKGLLKGSVGYIEFIVAAFFLVKGLLEVALPYLKQFKQNNEEKSDSFESGDLFSSISTIHEVEEEPPLPPSHSGLSPLYPNGEPFGYAKVAIYIILTFATGVFTGVLGTGSGANIVLILLLTTPLDIKQATATSCAAIVPMMLLTIALYTIFLTESLALSHIWPYLLVSVIVPIPSVIIGGLIVIRLPKYVLNFLISALLCFMGTAITAWGLYHTLVDPDFHI